MDSTKEPIVIQMASDIKVVTKPWGSETWLAYGAGMPYALKVIRIKAGAKTSLQYHRFKRETNYIYSGRIRFHYEKVPGGPIEALELGEGSCAQVPPGRIHRVEALEDVLLVEASTNHLDDVVRLSDDYQRPDGRIATEHGIKTGHGESK